MLEDNAAEDLLGEEPEKDEASGSEGSGEGDGGGKPAERDYSKNFEELSQRLQKAEEGNTKFLSELNTYKSELARERERTKQILLGFAGGDASQLDGMKAEQKAAQIKADFYKLFPKAQGILEGSQEEDIPPERMAFYNSAKERGMTRAKTWGADDIGAQTLCGLGDFLIQNIDALKVRFFKQGDTRVIDEVSDFIEKRVLGPILKAHEAKVLNRVRRTGLSASPLGERTGGSSGGKKPEAEQKLDFSAKGKKDFYDRMFYSAQDE